MSAEDYEAWLETAYLFKTRENARRLTQAYEDALNGAVAEHDVDLDVELDA